VVEKRQIRHVHPLGLYAQAGGIWKDHTGYGEWIMNEAKIPCAEYAALANDFNPKDFNAEEWVKLAKEAGQKYIVITSKHHEGFAMFKSDASAYNVYDATPFKRDVIDEMAKACRKYGMKLGLYYSQAQDWHHQGGAVAGGDWDDTHKGDMNKYIDEIAIPQVKEILSKYGDIAVLWWDTPVGMTEAMARKLHAITEQYPNLITNNRLGWQHRGRPGDSGTVHPRHGLPRPQLGSVHDDERPLGLQRIRRELEKHQGLDSQAGGYRKQRWQLPAQRRPQPLRHHSRRLSE
jgi:alpha-L-fucosidase